MLAHWAGADLQRATSGQHRPADRPLRADDAPGRRSPPAAPGASSVFELFPRRLPRAVGTASSRGVGRASDADRGLPLRRVRAGGPGRRRRPPDAGLARVVPLLGRRVGLPARARSTCPTPRCWSSRRASPRRLLLETLLLSIYNHDSAIASAASRMTAAAGDRPCIEMGSRRTHGRRRSRRPGRRTSPASRASRTSPRASGTASRPPAPARTASRCCTTRRPTRSAPRSPRWAGARRCSWTPTTSREAVRRGVEIAGPELGAVRLDSGDLGVLAHEVRAQLDALGATVDPR